MTQTGPERSEADRSLRRLCWIVALALLCTHALLAYLVRAQALTTGNDDALYLLLARSLRSLRYLDSHIVGAPVHAQYPPGFPAFLSLFGNSFHAAIVGSIVVSTIGLLFAYDLGRRVVGPVPGLLILAALAVNPSLINWAGSVRSESLFMTTSIAAIWCASRIRPTTAWLTAAGAFAIYAAMVRSVGVALVCALVLVWLIQRRYSAAMIFTALATLVVGGWLAWTAVAPGKFYGRSYAAALQRAESAPTAVGVLFNRVEASFAYLYKYIPSGLSVPSVEQTWADNLFWTVFLGIGLAAGLYALGRKLPIITAYLLLYAGILTLFPFKLTRFVIPIVPLLVLTIVAGLVLIAKRFTGRGTLVATALLCLPLMAGALLPNRRLLRTAEQCSAEIPWGPTACSDSTQRAFFAAADYARLNTAPEATFLTVKEATFALVASRRVQHPERVIRADSLHLTQTLRETGVDHIVISPIHRSRLSRLLERNCADLRLERYFPPDAYLFRVLPEPGSTDSEACSVLGRIRMDPQYSPRLTRQEVKSLPEE